jgi:hypothetical protein
MTRAKKLSLLYAELSRVFAELSATVLEPGHESAEARPAAVQAEPDPRAEATMRPPKQRPLALLPDDSVPEGMSKTGRKILVALAQLGRPLDRAQLGIMTGLSASTGPFGVALAQLRRDGLIDGGGKAMVITRAGLDALGQWTPLPTGHALFEYWCAKLGTTSEKILRALRKADRPLSKSDLGDATGLSSGTGPFGVALAELRRLQLIQGGGPAMTLSPDFARSLDPTINVFNTSNGQSVKLDARKGHAR